MAGPGLGRPPGWRVWLRWVAYTTLGYILRGLVTAAVPMRAPRDLVVTPLVGAIGVVILASLQWLILRHYLVRLRWWSWVAASALGQVAGTVVVTLAGAGSLILGPRLVGAIGVAALGVGTRVVLGGLLGGVVGVIQWLILRWHLTNAVWWIIATAVAGVCVALVPPTYHPGSGFSGTGALLAAQAISGMIVGTITGIAVILLLRKHRAAPSAELALP
jgi:hypothetical protein